MDFAPKSGCRNGAPDPRMTKITSALKPDRKVIFMSQTGRHILEPNGMEYQTSSLLCRRVQDKDNVYMSRKAKIENN